MRNCLFILFSLFGLYASGQSNFKTEETFLGVPVVKHHTILKPGDSLHFPPGSYIIEMIVISPGDYTVYSDDSPMIYPDAPGVRHIIHRNEGKFEMEGRIQEKIFDINGNEKYSDQAIVSNNGSFHVYFFTRAETTRISWKTTMSEKQL